MSWEGVGARKGAPFVLGGRTIGRSAQWLQRRIARVGQGACKRPG